MNNICIKRVCAKCGREKKVCCLVDGKPWCVDCFEKMSRVAEQLLPHPPNEKEERLWKI